MARPPTLGVQIPPIRPKLWAIPLISKRADSNPVPGSANLSSPEFRPLAQMVRAVVP